MILSLTSKYINIKVLLASLGTRLVRDPAYIVGGISLAGLGLMK